MKIFLFYCLFCVSLSGQVLTFFIHDPNNAKPDAPLPSVYQFPDTPVGGSSDIVVRIFNSSTSSVLLAGVAVHDASSAQSANFTITGQAPKTLAPSSPLSFEDVGVHFAPTVTGPISGDLVVGYSGQQDLLVASKLQGTATAAQLTLTCSGAPSQCNGSGLQPDSPTPLDFGNVSTISTPSITFTLTNPTSTELSTPAVSLQTEKYVDSAYTLYSSTLAESISPNSSASFTVTFTPGEPGPLLQATLTVGANNYLLAGTAIGSVAGDISSLVISCVDQTGADCSPQGRSIDFGELIVGATWTFQVSNPQTTINPVTINSVNAPAGFNLSSTWVGLPSCPASPSIPVTLQPGQCISFQLAFSGSVVGPYKSTLAIDARQFQITGIVPEPVGAPGSALSGIRLICGALPCTGQTFTSQQQVPLTVQLDSAASVESIFALGMAFASSLPGVSDDPAVKLIAPINGRTVNMKISIGSKTGTYNGQSQLTLQTGTTAGTIRFTLTYLEQPINLATITIPPEQVKIVSALAQRQAPNLVVTVGGYDNTYSVGQLAFTFYDTSGRVITSSPFQASVVASDFHQYFFGPEDLGGAFSVQASFPILNGDVTQVGSVAVSIANSAVNTPAATQTLTFQ